MSTNVYGFRGDLSSGHELIDTDGDEVITSYVADKNPEWDISPWLDGKSVILGAMAMLRKLDLTGALGDELDGRDRSGYGVIAVTKGGSVGYHSFSDPFDYSMASRHVRAVAEYISYVDLFDKIPAVGTLNFPVPDQTAVEATVEQLGAFQRDVATASVPLHTIGKEDIDTVVFVGISDVDKITHVHDKLVENFRYSAIRFSAKDFIYVAYECHGLTYRGELGENDVYGIAEV